MNKQGALAQVDAVRQLIAVRAFEIWESQGRPHGRDVMHWREAEQDIINCLGEKLPSGRTAAPSRPKAARTKR